ncbi:MAG: motility associated factor glycosyltransferase family protein [Epsilonproteobacteria bacterium]|nr:motility associated factor glycosyltransferase family protein [Campylobacterota bacterium]
MQSIETQAIENFHNNMDYLKKHHNELFHKVDIFQNGLESGYTFEKYTLEYKNEGYFDVQNLQTKEFLYSDNSEKISQSLCDQINFKKDHFSFQGFRLVYGFEDRELDDMASSHKDIYPIMSYYLERYPYETTMKKIEKFMFIGTGLGTHIEKVLQKTKSEIIFIVEDDLELFRLSLFTTPYYKLFSDKMVIFSIASNETDFSRDFRQFLENSFYLNRLLKYSYFPAHSKNKIQLMKSILASQNFLTFGYNTVLDKFLRPLQALNSYHFLNLAKHLQLKSITEKPVVVVGAGPSLDKNIQWLAQHQEDLIIFAVATSLRTLHKHNIKPDIVSHIDGFKYGYKNFETFPIKEFVKDSIAILGSFVEKRVIELFNKEQTFIFEEDTFYFNNFGSVEAPCIGSTSVANAILLGFKEIYLLGIDLALGKDGATHAGAHITSGKYDLEHLDSNLTNEISLRDDLFTVQGNFTEAVKTTPLFNNSIVAINNIVTHLKTEQQTIYNLNEGAHFRNTIAIHAKDITIHSMHNKKDVFNNFYNEILQLSQTKLSEEDLESMRQRLSYAKKTNKIIKKYQKRVTYTDINKYLYNLYGLIIELYPAQTRENRNITKVFDMFFQYVVPIIYDMCNTKEKDLKQLHEDIKRVDTLVVEALNNIINTYTKKIGTFLQKTKRAS